MQNAKHIAHNALNPFNSSCAITAPAGAEFEIYDLRGNVVWANPRGRPIEGGHPHGDAPTSHTFTWAPDETISSGIYLVKATTTDGYNITKRIIYLK